MAPSQRRRLAQLDVGRALRRHEPFGAALAGARERGASAREAVQPTERDVKGVGRGGEGAGNVAASRRRAVVEAVRALSDRAAHRPYACAVDLAELAYDVDLSLGDGVAIKREARRFDPAAGVPRPLQPLAGVEEDGDAAQQLLPRAPLRRASPARPSSGARLAVLVGGGSGAALARTTTATVPATASSGRSRRQRRPGGDTRLEGDDDDGGDDGDAGGGGGAWVDISGGYGGDEGEGEGEDDDDDEAASSVVPSSSVAALSRVSLAPLD